MCIEILKIKIFVADNEILDYILKTCLSLMFSMIKSVRTKLEKMQLIRCGITIMINAGARIVSQGDVITQDTYDILEELNLTDAGEFDWYKFSG